LETKTIEQISAEIYKINNGIATIEIKFQADGTFCTLSLALA
jgi:hypothetical protein